MKSILERLLKISKSLVEKAEDPLLKAFGSLLVDSSIFDWKHDVAKMKNWAAKNEEKGRAIYRLDVGDDQYHLFAMSKEINPAALQKFNASFGLPSEELVEFDAELVENEH